MFPKPKFRLIEYMEGCALVTIRSAKTINLPEDHHISLRSQQTSFICICDNNTRLQDYKTGVSTTQMVKHLWPTNISGFARPETSIQKKELLIVLKKDDIEDDYLYQNNFKVYISKIKAKKFSTSINQLN